MIFVDFSSPFIKFKGSKNHSYDFKNVPKLRDIFGQKKVIFYKKSPFFSENS